MRRRKVTTNQINARIDSTLMNQLEMHARANRVSFSEEIRARLVRSLAAEAKPGLAGDLESFKRETRDGAENFVREKGGNIEDLWPILRRVDSLVAEFYGAIETELSPLVSSSAIRELLRGTPADETKSKATQQE